MLDKYKVLLRRNEQRLQVERRRLGTHRQTLEREQGEGQRLLDEIEFFRNLTQARPLDGLEVDRQQLFSWLRRNAADQRRTQDLRLDLQRQNAVIADCTQEVKQLRSACRRIESRSDRYLTLVKRERKRMEMRTLNTEECEIEERASWQK